MILAAASVLAPEAPGQDALGRVLAGSRARAFLDGPLADHLPAAGSPDLEDPERAFAAVAAGLDEYLQAFTRRVMESIPGGAAAMESQLKAVKASESPAQAIHRCAALDKRVTELRNNMGHAAQDLRQVGAWLAVFSPESTTVDSARWVEEDLRVAGLAFREGREAQITEDARTFLQEGFAGALAETLRPMKDAPSGFVLRSWGGTRHRDKDLVTNGVLAFRAAAIKPGVRLMPFRAFEPDTARGARGTMRILTEAAAMGKARAVKALGWVPGVDPESPAGRQVVLGVEVQSQRTREVDLSVPELVLDMDVYRLLRSAVTGERLLAVQVPASEEAPSPSWVVGLFDLEGVVAAVKAEELMAPLARRGVQPTQTLRQAQRNAVAQDLLRSRSRGRRS
jgi:hypothetical protein